MNLQRPIMFLMFGLGPVFCMVFEFLQLESLGRPFPLPVTLDFQNLDRPPNGWAADYLFVPVLFHPLLKFSMAF